MKVLGGITLFFVTIILGIVLKAFVLTKYWLWFVLPSGLTSFDLNFAQAAAVSLVVSLLTGRMPSKSAFEKKKEEDGDFSDSLVFSFFFNLFGYLALLGVAYIIKLVLF